jgi:hypothetical protein
MATSSEWTTEQLVEKFGQFWSSRDGDGESEVADETTRTGSVNDRDSSLPCLGYINLDEEVKMRGEDFGEDLDFQTLVTEMEGEINGQGDQIVKFQTTKLAINKADMVWLFERFSKLVILIVPATDFYLSALLARPKSRSITQNRSPRGGPTRSGSRRRTPRGNFGSMDIHVKRFILDTSDVSKIKEAASHLSDLTIEQGFHDSGQLGAMLAIVKPAKFLTTVFISCDVSDGTIMALHAAPYLSTIIIDAENVDLNWFCGKWDPLITVHLYKYFQKTGIKPPQDHGGCSSSTEGEASPATLVKTKTTLRTLEINCCNEAGDEFSCLERFELTNLYLRNASTLRPTKLSPVFNPVVLQRLDVSYTRAAEDDLLRLLVEQKVALRVLIAVIAPCSLVQSDVVNPGFQGFTTDVLTSYLEWSENTKLEVLEVGGHANVHNAIFNANMACINSFRYFGCLFTGCNSVPGIGSNLEQLGSARQYSIAEEYPEQNPRRLLRSRSSAQHQPKKAATPLPTLTVKLSGPEIMTPFTTVDPTLIIECDPSGPTAGQFYRVSDQIKASPYVKPELAILI